MRELLDIPTQRRLKILEHLDEASGWISSNELAQENKASLRTISNDVSYLKEAWYPQFKIETSKKNGVRLKRQANTHMKILYRHIYENSDAFKLLEAIFFDTTLSIEKWGERLFISESSLYRIINEMSQSLESFGLSLEKKPCRIIGNLETNVRFFYTRFFKEKYLICDWPFEASRDISISFCQDLLHLSDTKVSEELLIQLSHLVNISLIRSSQGFFIKTKLSTEQSNMANRIRQDEQLTPKLNELLLTYNLKNETKEIEQLVYTFASFLTYWLPDEQIDFSVEHDIQQFLADIQETFNLKLPAAIFERLINKIEHFYLFYQIYPYQNYLIFDDYRQSALNIKIEFPILNRVIETLLKQMEETTDFPWYQLFHTKILFTLVTQWNHLTEQIDAQKKKVELLILTDLGENHGLYLTQQIKKNFRDKVLLHYYADPVTLLNLDSQEKFSKYDIVVTTFFTEFIPQDKLLIIDNIPSNRDWRTIRQVVNQEYQIKRKN